MSSNFFSTSKSFTASPNLFTKLRHFQPAKKPIFQEDKTNKNDESIRTNNMSKPKNLKTLFKPNSCKVTKFIDDNNFKLVSRERSNVSSDLKGYTTSPAQKAETSGRKLKLSMKSGGVDSQKILKLMKEKLHNFNDKSGKSLKGSLEKDNNIKEKQSLYNAIKQVLTSNQNNQKKNINKKNESRENSNESNSKQNLGHITSNLINININNLIKDPIKKLSNSQENLKKNTKSELIEIFLMKIEKKLSNFYKKFGQENENVSVMSFIDNFFKLLEELSNKEDNYSDHFSNIFKILKDIVELPFARIIEQFSKMREIYLQKLNQIKEIDQLKLDRENLNEKIKILIKELEKTKNQKIKTVDDSKPKTIEDLQFENDKLKVILQKQRKTLSNHLIKDEKIMKLLNAIRKKGVNIEQIYIENVQSSEESFTVSEQNEQEKNIIYEEDDTANFVLNSASTDQKNSMRKTDKKDKNKDSNNRLTFSFNQELNRESSREKDKNTQIKQQLKLNLNFLQKNDNLQNNFKNDIGFHEEFMSKMDEFSESWRQAALKEKRF